MQEGNLFWVVLLPSYPRRQKSSLRRPGRQKSLALTTRGSAPSINQAKKTLGTGLATAQPPEGPGGSKNNTRWHHHAAHGGSGSRSRGGHKSRNPYCVHHHRHHCDSSLVRRQGHPHFSSSPHAQVRTLSYSARPPPRTPRPQSSRRRPDQRSAAATATATPHPTLANPAAAAGSRGGG